LLFYRHRETQKSRKWLKEIQSTHGMFFVFVEARHHFSSSAFACVLFSSDLSSRPFLLLQGRHTRERASYSFYDPVKEVSQQYDRYPGLFISFTIPSVIISSTTSIIFIF